MESSKTRSLTLKIAHLTTVDMSLRFLVLPQLTEVIERGGEAVGISAPGPWISDLEAAGVRHVPLKSSTRGADLLSDFRAMLELWRALRREKPDILHTHNPKPGIYGRILGRLAGVPIVVNTVHGFYATPDDQWRSRAVVYGLEWVASRFSDVELYQNIEDLHLANRLHITPRDRSFFLGNGVDLERFDPDRIASADIQAIRSELGVSEDHVLIVAVGRLVEEKGYPELFKAMGQLDDKYVLAVAGPEDPSKGDSVTAQLISSASRDGVRFLGMRDDVDSLYGAADIFVLPSHREGFPRAAMEAAAMGLPLVLTDIRGCRQVVDDGVNGFLVSVRDPRDLAEAMASLGSDAALRKKMGEASRDKARSEFDERRVVSRVMWAYRRASEIRGIDWALDSSFAVGDAAFIRVAHPGDSASVGMLHATGIGTGFLSSLGTSFLTPLYREMIDHEDSVVLVAEDASGLIGFIAGSIDTTAFYRRFLSRSGFRALLSSALRLMRPTSLRMAWETFKYGQDKATGPELLAISVIPEVRRLGVGDRLVSELLERLSERGSSEVNVVVAESNRGARALYERAGFDVERSMEVHAGEPSILMKWSAQ